MAEKLTRHQIYNQLHFERKMKLALVFLNPDSPDDYMEIASRKGHIHAVQNTWYWYNNQENFREKCFYPINTKI